MCAKIFKFYRLPEGNYYSPTISSMLYVEFWLKHSIHKRYKIITKLSSLYFFLYTNGNFQECLGVNVCQSFLTADDIFIKIT